MYGSGLHTGHRAVACSRRLNGWLGSTTTTRFVLLRHSGIPIFYLLIGAGAELICIYVSLQSFSLLFFFPFHFSCVWFISNRILLSVRGLNHGWPMDPIIVYGYGIWIPWMGRKWKAKAINRSIWTTFFYFFYNPCLSVRFHHHINFYFTPLVCPCW